MIRKILSIILLTPAALAKMKPDVSFTGENDRFDLTETVSAHNKMFRDTPQVDDDEDEGSDSDYRRNLRSEDTEKFLRNLNPPLVVLTRRKGTDVAYDSENLPKIRGAGVDDIVSRRHLSKKYTEKFFNALKKEHHRHAPHTRRADGDFAEDDSKNSFEGGTVSDFEENLKKFRVNSRTRRKLNDDELAEEIIVLNVAYSNES